MNKKELEIDFSSSLAAEKKKGKAPLNKPFRLPQGSKKKFGVYVKNDKGNIVMVKFGDPNMSIKRDNPARRKAFRSRHSCDDNPGPKYKARYWSCRMWEAKKSVTDYTKGNEEITLEAEIQAKGKGLWYNIQQKKKRMGKNYRPAPEGSKDRPSQEAIKRAQASDYLNEEYEWDGETEFDQIVFLEDKSLAQVEEVEDIEDEYEDYKEDFYGMIVGSINSIYQHSKNVMDKINDPMVKENLTEPFLQSMAALAEDYMITIHNYVMFNKENEEGEEMNEMEESESSMMFKVGDKVKNINAECKHYGSEGVVKEIRELPDDMGYAVVYECTNEGASWKKGDMLGKTEIQLQKIQAEWSMKYKRSIDCNNPKGFSQKQHCKSKASEDKMDDDKDDEEKYEMEKDEEYKTMTVSEGQKFNDFLKQCIPTKQGDDKTKFKSCLQDYRNKK